MGLAVHNKVMHEGLMLLQQSTPGTLQFFGAALTRSIQSEKKALLSPFLEQAMMLSVLVAQEREVLHSKGWDMAPENHPQVAAFSTLVMIRSWCSIFSGLLELTRLFMMTPPGGGTVVGETRDIDLKKSSCCWRFLVTDGGAILDCAHETQYLMQNNISKECLLPGLSSCAYCVDGRKAVLICKGEAD